MPKSNKKPNKINKNRRKIYLDYASSALLNSTNPGAIHELGVSQKNKLEEARRNVAHILNARDKEIIFTSGATESNNLAIQGIVLFARTSKIPHIITTNIEHASVLEVCKYLEKNKIAEVTYVEVESNGIVDPKKIKKSLKQNTLLVSVMYANNEIGTVQPIREIAKEIRHFNKVNSKKVYFHSDAVQAINYLPIHVDNLGVDMMSFNGAKIYGPTGVGVLFVRSGTPINAIMFGGDQERGLRPGTENVVGVLGLVKALTETEKIKEKETRRPEQLRNYFFKKISPKIPNIIINGDIKNRLPNNINITIPKIPSDLLVIELSARGIYVSAKSACKSGDGKASHVIQAINIKAIDTDGSIRFSLGRHTRKSDIDYTVHAFLQIIAKLKKWYS